MAYSLTRKGKEIRRFEDDSLDMVVFKTFNWLTALGMVATSYWIGDRTLIIVSKPGKGTTKLVVKEVK